MPEQIFLTEREPLVFKAARWLADQDASRPLDLSRWIVVVPTAGAARRLRAELARMAENTGLLPPTMISPMGLLGLNAPGNIAARTDCLLAWTDVLSRASAERYPMLLAGFTDVGQSAFRIAQSMMEICSLLAEAGLTPASPEILRACPNDEERWREIGSLYRRYQQRLDKAKLVDPNAWQISVAETGGAPSDIDRIVVAGVPDINRLVEGYLGRAGIPVTILVDAADCEDAKFDSWGRPDEEYWGNQLLPEIETIPLADPVSEATAVARMLGSAALCVADSALAPYLQKALLEEGKGFFDPAGKPLARFECAAIARIWLSFCRRGSLPDLRALMEHPAFLEKVCEEAGLAPYDVLHALDQLAAKSLINFLPDALGKFRNSGEAAISRLVVTAEKWRANFDTAKSLEKLPSFLEHLYSSRVVASDSPETMALSALGDLLHSLLGSPLANARAAEELFAAEIQTTPVYDLHGEDAVELNGWLEAPWLPNEALILTGCTEGALPSNISGHPFLPDSLRVALGMQGNSDRLARDIYLLHSLLACRPSGLVRVTLCRTGAEGEPSRPSRLLFRCPDRDLPSRVRHLFGHAPVLRVAHARQKAWMLDIPRKDPPKSLSVTAFGSYLDCPLRFYLKHSLRMDTFDPLKAEMDALDFGTMLHNAVEGFSLDTDIRDSLDAQDIEKHVLAELDAVLARDFGARLSLPVRVQRESLRARLRKFARLQAQEREAGWKIVEAETKFEAPDTITLGGIPIAARIDRVEINERTGQRRILDYKTYKSAKNHLPADTHYGRLAGGAPIPEAEFEIDGKPRRWLQLQLPLYRALARHRWPDDAMDAVTGYFLLPEKIEESGVFDFVMDDALFDSAMACARAVAERVSRGVFWPPADPLYESFEEIFLGEDPVDLFSPDAIKFLEGHAAA